MSTDNNNPDENPPEIEIEIEPASGTDAPPPTEESSPEPPVFDDLPDLPPVPDGDLADLPEITDDDLADLPDIPGDPPEVSVEPDLVVSVGDPVLPDIGVDTTIPELVETPKPVVGKLVLQSVSSPDQKLPMQISTKVGKHLCRSMGEDHKFMHPEQMELEKTDSGWQVKTNASAENETLLNGSAVVGVQPLKEGDVLSVGRESKGVSKMEMRVSFP